MGFPSIIIRIKELRLWELIKQLTMFNLNSRLLKAMCQIIWIVWNRLLGLHTASSSGSWHLKRNISVTIRVRLWSSVSDITLIAVIKSDIDAMHQPVLSQQYTISGRIRGLEPKKPTLFSSAQLALLYQLLTLLLGDGHKGTRIKSMQLQN